MSLEKSQKFRARSRFSKREAECLYYMLRGMSAKQIAQHIKLSPRTVESYLHNIKMKLRCRKKSEVIAAVLENPEIYKEAMACLGKKQQEKGE